MKLSRQFSSAGYSIGEMMIAVAITGVLLAASYTTLSALQKSYSAVENYFSTHLQQIRIIDYLSRDVKRSLTVTTSADRATVTCSVPTYVANGKRNTPGITITANGVVVDYGRTVNDAVLTDNSQNITSATANFSAADVGKKLAIASFTRPGTTIQSVTSPTQAVMSKKALQSGSSVRATIVSTPATVVYALDNQEIKRIEDGVQTTIAKSTDSLVPDTTDVELANTEYTVSNVTFLPSFNFNPASAAGATNPGQGDYHRHKRAGTAVYATSYLRNKRR